MTFLVERLADLRRQLDHVEAIRHRIAGSSALIADLTLHNDVMFALLMICQGVIDISGELASRHGVRFQDFNGAIRALAQVPGFPVDLVELLVPLAGFRNVVVHEYVELDYDRVIAALDHLGPVRQFIAAVATLERSAGNTDVG